MALNRAERMKELLMKAFNPEFIAFKDDSDQHKGHGGWREGGETHYTLEISLSAFPGQSRVSAERAIYKVLMPEFQSGLHALSIKFRY